MNSYPTSILTLTGGTNGACGPANDALVTVSAIDGEPGSALTLCSAGPGVQSPPTPVANPGVSYAWTCPGSGQGIAASCQSYLGWDVTLTAGANGTLSCTRENPPSGAATSIMVAASTSSTRKVWHNHLLTCTATPAVGYAASLSASGPGCGGASGGTIGPFVGAGACTISATFAEPYFTLHVPDVWADLTSYDQAHVIASMQAIANGTTPTLFLLDSAGIHQFWLDRLRLPGQALATRPFVEMADFQALLDTFRDRIDGAVVWGEDCWACRNVAITAAGADGRRLVVLRRDDSAGSVYNQLTLPVTHGGAGIPVVIDLTHKFTGTGTIPDTAFPSTGSIKCDAYKWALAKYVQTPRVDPNLVAYRLDGYWVHKAAAAPDVGYAYDNDYLISKRAFVFDLDPWADEVPVDDPGQPLGTDFQTMRAIYDEVYRQADHTRLIKTIGFPPFTAKFSSLATYGPGPASIHDPVETEWRTAEIASRYNSFLEADIEGTMNTSFYQYVPRATYTQHAPSGNSKKWLYDQGYFSRTTGVAGGHFVLLTVSDFDAVSWMQAFLMGPWRHLWTDSARGRIPLAWAFDPQLVDRAPNIFNYVYETRTPNDFFVGGDSGAGYLNPSFLLAEMKWAGAVTVEDGVDAWVAHNRRFYGVLGVSITNNLINGNAGLLNQPALLARLGDFSPDGVSALTGPDMPQLLGGTPFVKTAGGTADNGDVAAVSNAILGALGAGRFHQFRTLLVSPSTLEQAASVVVAARPDVTFVDPYTFFELMKASLGADIVPPACNFQINNGAPVTTSPQVLIGTTINYTDYGPNGSGVVRLRLSNDLIQWQEFALPAGAGIPWTLAEGSGERTVFMQAQDGAGNWGNSDSETNACSASITVAP